MPNISPQFLTCTTGVLHVYADGTLGNDTNDGQQTSTGTEGSFAIGQEGVVTFTAIGNPWGPNDVGRLITINYATSPGNNISAEITGVEPGGDRLTYVNPRAVAEDLPTTGRWSVSRPKKTLQAVFDLVPDFVKHNVCVHLSGSFDLTGQTCTLARTVVHPGTLLVDGGTATTVFKDNAGSPYVADIATASAIGSTNAGWVPDSHLGYLVEILSGPAAGQTRMIQGNTADAITPCRNFSQSPGAGAEFRIVKPATELTGGGDYWIHVRNDGPGGLRVGASGDYSSLQFQSLYLGGVGRFDVAGSGYHHFSHIVCLPSGPIPGVQGAAFFAEQVGYLEFTGHRRHPFTFVRENAAGNSQAGWGQPLSPTTGLAIYCRTAHLAPTINQSAIGGVVLAFKTQSVMVAEGSRIMFLGLIGTPQNLGFSPQPGIASSPSYAITRFGGRNGRPGIYLLGSSGSIGAVEIDAGDPMPPANEPLAGVELDNSHLYVCGVATSPAGPKQKWGVWGHSMSVIHVKKGVVPALRGTSGDLTVDKVAPVSTWQALATTPVIMTELVAKTFTELLG